MISKDIVNQIVEEFLQEKEDYFLVEVSVSTSNRICVEIDSFEGVDIDTCISLNRFIESKLDREIEDYELEVGSVGLTSPFKIIQQYEKNIDNEVEVLTKDGNKLIGILRSVNDNTFVVEVSQKMKLEGKSKKEIVIQLHTFAYTEVKYTKYNLRFK
ncbi:MAG: ribosome assembly cofactor RimP [Paludibacteraceae bacterium]|nr:ribosome assembly cofactor RimP [Paludibacteraceae bacterium]MBP6284179.1 ribosome assembly cofactor RimP [Paludibacteraceae bacterium]